MAFRLSQLKPNGERTQSVLINEGHATISSSTDADLNVALENNASIKISEKNGLCKLEVKGISVSHRTNTTTNGEICLGVGSEFSCGDYRFYATIVSDGSLTKFKKGYLATAAVFLTWSLLFIQIIVPAWLPYKITSHTKIDRNVMVEQCSSGLDALRRRLKASHDKISSISNFHNDVMSNLKDEIEQITWTYRNAGELMSAEQLSNLLTDIAKYQDILSKLESSKVISVEPINTHKILEGLPL